MSQILLPVSILIFLLSVLGIIFGLSRKKTLLFWLSLVLLIFLVSFLFWYTGLLSPFFLIRNTSLWQFFSDNPSVITYIIIFAFILELPLFYLVEMYRRQRGYVSLSILIISILFLLIFIIQAAYPVEEGIPTPKFAQVCISAPGSIGCKKASDLGPLDVIVRFCTSVYSIQATNNNDGSLKDPDGLKNNVKSISPAALTLSGLSTTDLTNALGAGHYIKGSDNEKVIPVTIDTNNAAKLCLDPGWGGFYLYP